MKKKLLLSFLLIALFALVGCAEAAPNFEYDADVMADMTKSVVAQYDDLSDTAFQYYSTSGDKLAESAAEGFRLAQDTDKVGKFVGYDTSENGVSFANGTKGDILCSIIAKYENRDVKVTVSYVPDLQYDMQKDMYMEQLAAEAMMAGYTDVDSYVTIEYADYAMYGFDVSSAEALVDAIIASNGEIYPYKGLECEVSAVYSRAELLTNAGQNTIIGMVTVFVVLIFIALIIYLLKFVPALVGGKKEEKKAAPKAQPVAKTEAPKAAPAAPVAPAAEEELVDDGELVAVITAALQAYLSAEGQGSVRPAACTDSNDKLVVRSIRRVR